MAGAARTPAFGQAVIGPPGSGKTTYCLGMSEFLRAMGRRVAVVNLDPANEGLPPSGTLHAPWLLAQHLLPDGSVGPQADCCPPGRFSLLHRPCQVHFSTVHLPGHYAACRAAPRQPPLQDGPH
uniref:GPN-loop GTPase 2 n=1 Tax=Pipistrellus kuhlii TaxID=59472 RepID=A0A7J8A6Q8_PIPKU|nr:GPN-loop GTPase 2 [Pipistrellus kuhlii]